MNFFGKAKTILAFAVDCLFPRCCVICNRRADVDGYCNLCSSCMAEIPWIGTARCSICSRPMGEDSTVCCDGGLVCAECKENMPHFKYCLSCWVHSGIGREIILALKYRNADFLKNDIVKLLEDNCKEACELIQNSILVPVPMHYFRRVQRGYNQARVICDAILKIAGGSKIVDMLSSRHKKPQTSLGAKERLLNIKNVFECAAVSRSIPKDSKIVLVDDVFTTGATARECCRVLHTNGFENLYVLTLSRG